MIFLVKDETNQFFESLKNMYTPSSQPSFAIPLLQHLYLFSHQAQCPPHFPDDPSEPPMCLDRSGWHDISILAKNV